MTVRDTLVAITSELANAIGEEIEISESIHGPNESKDPTLLDIVLNDLTKCGLAPAPASLTDEDQFCQVTNALERFVDVFFVPVVTTPKASIGITTIMTWFELWEAQFRSDHTEFSEPSFVEGTLRDVESLVESLRSSQATSGSVRISTPGGNATLAYERTSTGWSTTLVTHTGEVLGFPHKLCLLTMNVSPGQYTYPIPIQEMLVEPRTYQLRPFSARGFLERGSGQTWWPHP